MSKEKPTPPPVPGTREPTVEIKAEELEEVDLIGEARRIIKELIANPTIDNISKRKIPHDPELLAFKALIRVQRSRKELGLPQMGHNQMEAVLEAIREEIKSAGVAE